MTDVELPELYKVVVVPRGKVDTGKCYRLYDEIGGEGGDVDEFVRELKRGRLPKPFNALERAANVLNPRIKEAKDVLEKVGFKSGMTGSGSAVFGIENDREAYEYKKKKLIEYAPYLDVYAEKE